MVRRCIVSRRADSGRRRPTTIDRRSDRRGSKRVTPARRAAILVDVAARNQRHLDVTADARVRHRRRLATRARIVASTGSIDVGAVDRRALTRVVVVVAAFSRRRRHVTVTPATLTRFGRPRRRPIDLLRVVVTT